MSDSGFSEELERFIKEQIRSLEQLEILLLLSSAPGKKWTEQAVYEVIKSRRASVSARLNELVSQKLLSTATATVFTFSPESETVKRLLQELAVAYKQRPVRVVELLYSRPPDAVQEFAKAFKLRKEP